VKGCISASASSNRPNVCSDFEFRILCTSEIVWNRSSGLTLFYFLVCVFF
jgi:hypothetical protein